MPRTRLVWHLFVGWCFLVAAVLAGCFWLGSVQIGSLATEGERQRLEELGRRLAAAVAKGDGDPAARTEELRRFAATTITLPGRSGACGSTAYTCVTENCVRIVARIAWNTAAWSPVIGLIRLAIKTPSGAAARTFPPPPRRRSRRPSPGGVASRGTR